MTPEEWKVLPQTRKDAWWLWTALQCEIPQQCEMLIHSDSFESSLPALEPGDTLSYFQPWYEKLVLSYDAAERKYVMNVDYDPDLLSVRFSIDNDPHVFELLIVRRRKRSYFMDSDGFLLTSHQAGQHIVRSLLVGWWPASYDTAVAA